PIFLSSFIRSFFPCTTLFRSSSIGTISIYETGNEEDYSGTPTQYAIQAERFYNDIHAINPSALFVETLSLDSVLSRSTAEVLLIDRKSTRLNSSHGSTSYTVS